MADINIGDMVWDSEAEVDDLLGMVVERKYDGDWWVVDWIKSGIRTDVHCDIVRELKKEWNFLRKKYLKKKKK